MTMKRLLMAAVVLSLTGCATVPPLIHDVQSRSTFNAEYVVLVESVKEFFVKENIPVKTADDNTGMIEADETKVPYEGFQYRSDYCDCGTLGGLYVYHEILGMFKVYIKEEDENTTSVDIDAAYRASLWRYRTFIGWAACQSRGYMENKLITYLHDSLKENKKDK